MGDIPRWDPATTRSSYSTNSFFCTRESAGQFESGVAVSAQRFTVGWGGEFCFHQILPEEFHQTSVPAAFCGRLPWQRLVNSAINGLSSGLTAFGSWAGWHCEQHRSVVWAQPHSCGYVGEKQKPWHACWPLGGLCKSRYDVSMEVISHFQRGLLVGGGDIQNRHLLCVP